MRGTNRAHAGNPSPELREEHGIGHGDRELPALDSFRAFVGGFQLGVHPLMPNKSWAILGDAIAAHQADGLAHDVRAMAGIPELGGRAEHIGQRVEQHEFYERVGGLLSRRRTGLLDQAQCCSFELLHFLKRGAAGQLALPEDGVLLAFEWIEFVE